MITGSVALMPFNATPRCSFTCFGEFTARPAASTLYVRHGFGVRRIVSIIFGGSAGNISIKDDELQHMVSYYDHKTGTVPRPVMLLQKRTEDAHDNPTLSLVGLLLAWRYFGALFQPVYRFAIHLLYPGGLSL